MANVAQQQPLVFASQKASFRYSYVRFVRTAALLYYLLVPFAFPLRKRGDSHLPSDRIAYNIDKVNSNRRKAAQTKAHQ